MFWGVFSFENRSLIDFSVAELIASNEKLICKLGIFNILVQLFVELPREGFMEEIVYFRIIHTFLIVFAPPGITNIIIFRHYHEVLKIMHFSYPVRYYPKF